MLIMRGLGSPKQVLGASSIPQRPALPDGQPAMGHTMPAAARSYVQMNPCNNATDTACSVMSTRLDEECAFKNRHWSRACANPR